MRTITVAVDLPEGGHLLVELTVLMTEKPNFSVRAHLQRDEDDPGMEELPASVSVR